MDLVYLVKVVYTSDCSVLLTSWEVTWLVQYQLAKWTRAQSRGTTFVTTDGGSKIRNSQPQITKIGLSSQCNSEYHPPLPTKPGDYPAGCRHRYCLHWHRQHSFLLHSRTLSSAIIFIGWMCWVQLWYLVLLWILLVILQSEHWHSHQNYCSCIICMLVNECEFV